MKDNGKIVAPLIALINKNAFNWSPATEEPFHRLKDAMYSTPVLAMLNFSKTFIIESDAFGVGNKVVLMQEGCPLAFIEKSISGKNLAKSTYEKEMLVIIHFI